MPAWVDGEATPIAEGPAGEHHFLGVAGHRQELLGGHLERHPVVFVDGGQLDGDEFPALGGPEHDRLDPEPGYELPRLRRDRLGDPSGGLHVGFVPRLVDELEGAVGEGVHLALLRHEPVGHTPGGDMHEEGAAARLADGGGEHHLRRPEVVRGHGADLPFTWTMWAGRPGVRSTTLIEAGEQPIRWNRSRGWPR